MNVGDQLFIVKGPSTEGIHFLLTPTAFLDTSLVRSIEVQGCVGLTDRI